MRLKVIICLIIMLLLNMSIILAETPEGLTVEETASIVTSVGSDAKVVMDTKLEKVDEPKAEEPELKEITEELEETFEEVTEEPVIFLGEAELIYEEEVTAARPSGEYQQYAYSLFPEYGWSDYDFECLVALWNRESNWNPYAENPSSGAYGIPQSLPASKMASVGDDYLTNGYTQIIWGLQYIAGRYGNPANAWAHSEATGWY